MWFLVFINQLISIGYGVNCGAAFGAPSDAIISYLRVAFFVSKILYPQGFPRFVAQSESTRFNLHQLTYEGTTAGISRFDNVCTLTEPLEGYSSWL